MRHAQVPCSNCRHTTSHRALHQLEGVWQANLILSHTLVGWRQATAVHGSPINAPSSWDGERCPYGGPSADPPLTFLFLRTFLLRKIFLSAIFLSFLSLVRRKAVKRQPYTALRLTHHVPTIMNAAPKVVPAPTRHQRVNNFVGVGRAAGPTYRRSGKRKVDCKLNN